MTYFILVVFKDMPDNLNRTDPIPGLDELPEVHFEFLNRQIDNGFFNRPIIAHAQILVHSWGPRRIRIHGTVSQTDLYNQSLVSSVVQVK